MARIQPVDLGVDPADLDQPMRVQLGVGGIIAHRPDIASAHGSLVIVEGQQILRIGGDGDRKLFRK